MAKEMSNTTKILIAAGLVAVAIVGGAWMFTVYRTTSTVNKIVDKGEAVVTGTVKLVDTAKEADYDKIGEKVDQGTKKAGEVTDKAFDKTADGIRKLKEAWQEKK